MTASGADVCVMMSPPTCRMLFWARFWLGSCRAERVFGFLAALGMTEWELGMTVGMDSGFRRNEVMWRDTGMGALLVADSRVRGNDGRGAQIDRVRGR